MTKMPPPCSALPKYCMQPAIPGRCPVLPPCADMLHQFAESLGLALDARDHFTRDHSRQVADLAGIIASGLNLGSKQIDLIHIAGHLHDIGKIGLPGYILNKPGALTHEEWKMVKQHPVIGAGIVAPIRLFKDKDSIRDIVLHHHERIDGKGYPDGLKDREIPLGARVIAVADALSAMMQVRSYRKAFSFDHAVQEIFDNAGTQFSHGVVNSFLKQLDKIEAYFLD
ncbi:MAG: HD-GYP domain-containing protein [Thermodesulfobacteriota bacterium]